MLNFTFLSVFSPIKSAPRWPTLAVPRPPYLHYPPADPYGDRTHQRKFERPPTGVGGTDAYSNNNNYHRLTDADGRPDVRPVYRPPPQSAVVVNSKAVNGLQRPPPMAVRPLNNFPQQAAPLPGTGQYNPKLSLPYSQSAPWRQASTAAPDTRWYRGDYPDAFQQTHEYYNLDVVAAPGTSGDRGGENDEEEEYEYYEEESR